MSAPTPSTPQAWALKFIEDFGQVDGAHHKQWVIDQVARVLLGAPVTTMRREGVGCSWDVQHAGTSPAYEEWVAKQRAGEDGPDTFDYDVGISP